MTLSSIIINENFDLLESKTHLVKICSFVYFQIQYKVSVVMDWIALANFCCVVGPTGKYFEDRICIIICELDEQNDRGWRQVDVQFVNNKGLEVTLCFPL